MVALLTMGLFGGLAIERWRARHPVIADRLETEPARAASAAPAHSTPRGRPRSAPARCEEPGIRVSRTGWRDTAPAGPRLDLNRATPGELARVAGISWRLAARIVAAREAFEGREDRPRDPAGDPLPAASEPPAADTEPGPPPTPTPDADTP